MNARLFLQTVRWQGVSLVIVMVAAFGWGMLIPVFYDAFSDAVRQLARTGAFPEELLSFGSGSLFTLPGAITLGTQHPVALAMLGIFAVGATSTAIAGERQRGTLEVLLARPLSRTALYATVTAALLLVVVLVLIALLGGMLAGSLLLGIAGQIDATLMPLVVLNGFMLWAAFATFALAASVSFDRAGPAISLALAYLLIHYFLEILGSLWTDAAWTQEYSLFHRFQPGLILTDGFRPLDLLIVTAAAVIPIIYALIVFPRRDLAAPS
jgi:ABC-2 type transport system permease protein